MQQFASAIMALFIASTTTLAAAEVPKGLEPLPLGSSAGSFGVVGYQLSRNGPEVSAAAWGRDGLVATLTVEWRDETVFARLENASGERMRVTMNFVTGDSSVIDDQGREREFSWIPEGGGKLDGSDADPTEGAWGMKDDETRDPATMFSRDEKETLTLLGIIYGDVVQGLRLLQLQDEGEGEDEASRFPCPPDCLGPIHSAVRLGLTIESCCGRAISAVDSRCINAFCPGCCAFSCAPTCIIQALLQ